MCYLKSTPIKGCISIYDSILESPVHCLFQVVMGQILKGKNTVCYYNNLVMGKNTKEYMDETSVLPCI